MAPSAKRECCSASASETKSEGTASGCCRNISAIFLKDVPSRAQSASYAPSSRAGRTARASKSAEAAACATRSVMKIYWLFAQYCKSIQATPLVGKVTLVRQAHEREPSRFPPVRSTYTVPASANSMDTSGVCLRGSNDARGSRSRRANFSVFRPVTSLAAQSTPAHSRRMDTLDTSTLWLLTHLLAELGDASRVGVVLELLDVGELRVDEAVALLRWLH